MRHLLTAICILVQLSCFSQIEKNKLDSLNRVIDSGVKNQQAAQDSFTKRQDSIYQARVIKKIKANNKNLDFVVQQIKDIKAKEKRQTLIRIGIGFLLLTLLFVVLIRKRKKSGKN